MNRTPKKAEALVVVVLVSFAVFGWLRFAILAAGLLVHPGPLTPGEGALTYEVGALAAGALYTAPESAPYAVVRHLPAYHFLVAILGVLMPVRIAGRFISLFATVASAVLVSNIILEGLRWNRRGPRRRTGWNIAWASFCGASTISLYPMGFLGVVAQPDAFALAMSLLGILGWLRGLQGRRTGWLMALSRFYSRLSRSQCWPSSLSRLWPLLVRQADRSRGLAFLLGWSGSAAVTFIALYFATDGYVMTHLMGYAGNWGQESHIAAVLNYLFGPLGWLCALEPVRFFGRITADAENPSRCVFHFWLVGWFLVFGGQIQGVSFERSLFVVVVLWVGLGFGWMKPHGTWPPKTMGTPADSLPL